jgi:hypothetical protein
MAEWLEFDDRCREAGGIHVDEEGQWVVPWREPGRNTRLRADVYEILIQTAFDEFKPLDPRRPDGPIGSID